MIQNCEPILIAARGKTPTVPRRSFKSATSQLGNGGYEPPRGSHRRQTVDAKGNAFHRLAAVATNLRLPPLGSGGYELCNSDSCGQRSICIESIYPACCNNAVHELPPNIWPRDAKLCLERHCGCLRSLPAWYAAWQPLLPGRRKVAPRMKPKLFSRRESDRFWPIPVWNATVRTKRAVASAWILTRRCPRAAIAARRSIANNRNRVCCCARCAVTPTARSRCRPINRSINKPSPI